MTFVYPKEGYPPRYKRDFCDAYPVRMRLAGWDDRTCTTTRDYLHSVADTYTGNAWRNFAKDCDAWLAKATPATGVAGFPHRSGSVSLWMRLRSLVLKD